MNFMYFVSISGPEHNIRYSDPLLAGWSGDRIPVGMRFATQV